MLRKAREYKRGEVGMVSDPAHAEESEAADFTSEDPQTSSDTDVETPPKKRRLDPNFLLVTPERRCLGEYPAISNSLFLGQTSQLRAFVDQVNATSVCATPCCSAKPVSVTLAGLGGALEVKYSYTGCDQDTMHDLRSHSQSRRCCDISREPNYNFVLKCLILGEMYSSLTFHAFSCG